MPSMLPSLPKSFGRLSDVFESALGSITASGNRLGLRRTKNACVILVDGLGYQNLRDNAGYARFISKQELGRAYTVFPSTTAAAISSFATGNLPGEHGIVGYQVWDEQNKLPVNLLTGLLPSDVGRWQRVETVSERAELQGVSSFSVGPAEYAASGFTAATMPKAQFVAGKSLQDRFDAAAEILTSGTQKLVYLYVPELDQRAHAHGTKSHQWTEKLEELDSVLEEFVSRVGNRAGIILTADHGIVDVDSSRHVYLDEYAEQLQGLRFVGGDPRVAFLYLESGVSCTETIANLQAALVDRADCFSRTEVLEAGFYGDTGSQIPLGLPDIFVFARPKSAVYHRNFAKPKSLKMIGQHGGLSPEEITIPLIKLGAYA